MSKLGLAGSALLATAGGATTLASGLTITAHASEKPQTNTQTNQADKLKKASNQLDTASKQQAKMINALLESKVDAQVPTQPGTYTKSVALLDASGKQLGTATLTRVVNADGSSQSSLSKDIPAGYTLKDVSVLNHYPSAVTLTRVAGATQAGTTTKAIKLTDANGKLIANGTVTRVVDEKGASTVSVKGIPQGYKVASMDVLRTFPDQLVIEKGEAINSNTAEKTDTGTMNNVPAGGTTTDSKKILDSGGVTKTAGQGNATAGNQNGTTNTGADKGNTANTGNTTAGQGNQQTGNTTSGTTTDNTASQNGQAQQGGTTTTDQGKADAGTTTNTGADSNKGQQTSDASKDSSKTSTDSKTTTDQGKTDTKKDDSKTSTSTTDSAKKDDTKKDDSKASTDEKKDDSKSETSKTNDTNSKVDNAIKGIDSVAKSSTDATKSVDNKSSDTGKKDDSKKSDSSKSDDKKSDDKKSDKKDGKLDLSDTTNALKKSSKDDDKKDSSAKKSDSDDSSKKDNVSNLLNKSANKSSNASDNAKVADANVSDNLSGKDGSTKKGITSSSTNATLPETGNTQSTAGILAGSAMVATMTALGIGVAHRKRS